MFLKQLLQNGSKKWIFSLRTMWGYSKSTEMNRSRLLRMITEVTQWQLETNLRKTFKKNQLLNQNTKNLKSKLLVVKPIHSIFFQRKSRTRKIRTKIGRYLKALLCILKIGFYNQKVKKPKAKNKNQKLQKAKSTNSKKLRKVPL